MQSSNIGNEDYIAICDDYSRTIFAVPEQIGQVKDILQSYLVDQKDISIFDTFEEMGFPKWRIPQMAMDVSDKFISEYAQIPEFVFSQWRSPYDIMITVLDNMDPAELERYEIKDSPNPRYWLNDELSSSEDDYVTIEVVKEGFPLTRVFHVPGLKDKLFSVMSQNYAIPIEQLSLDDEIDYIKDSPLEKKWLNSLVNFHVMDMGVIPVTDVDNWLILNDIMVSIVNADKNYKRSAVRAQG